MTSLGFGFVLISFVHMHGTVVVHMHSLFVQVVQIKQTECKMSTKNVNNYK